MTILDNGMVWRQFARAVDDLQAALAEGETLPRVYTQEELLLYNMRHVQEHP